MKTGNVIHHLIPEILFKFQAKNSFKMAAMPFPFIGILLIQCNLTRVILVFTLNYASFLFPYINLLFSFIGNGLDLSLIIIN